MITTAGHGKCLVDSLAGTDKHHLDHGRISEMDPTRVDEHHRAKSEAAKACIFLSSADRMLGSIQKHKLWPCVWLENWHKEWNKRDVSLQV